MIVAQRIDAQLLLLRAGVHMHAPSRVPKSCTASQALQRRGMLVDAMTALCTLVRLDPGAPQGFAAEEDMLHAAFALVRAETARQICHTRTKARQDMDRENSNCAPGHGHRSSVGLMLSAVIAYDDQRVKGKSASARCCPHHTVCADSGVVLDQVAERGGLRVQNGFFARFCIDRMGIAVQSLRDNPLGMQMGQQHLACAANRQPPGDQRLSRCLEPLLARLATPCTGWQDTSVYPM